MKIIEAYASFSRMSSASAYTSAISGLAYSS